jgi:calcium uptake protein 1, mitochondrial
MAAGLARLRSAVERLGSSRARARARPFSAAVAEAAAAVTASSGLGIWLLSSNPHSLADSGQAEDAATAGGGGNIAFPAAVGGVGATGEREGRFLFGGELPWLSM